MPRRARTPRRTAPSRTSPIAMLTSGPDAAMAASSPGFGDAGSSGVEPPKNVTTIGSNVHAPPAGHEGVREVVRDRAHEEAERDDRAEEPRRRLLDLGIDRRQLADRDDRDQREDDRPSRAGRGSRCRRSARSGCRSRPSLRGREERAGARAPPRAGAPATWSSSATTSATTPTAIAVSDQKLTGKSCTRRSVAGSNV